jgi:hypothetical protein
VLSQASQETNTKLRQVAHRITDEALSGLKANDE